MATTRDVTVFVGSLRKESFNRKMAKTLLAIAPAPLKLEIVEIGQLPLYNQDDDAHPPAASAAQPPASAGHGCFLSLKRHLQRANCVPRLKHGFACRSCGTSRPGFGQILMNLSA